MVFSYAIHMEYISQENQKSSVINFIYKTESQDKIKPGVFGPRLSFELTS
jgi:hypothetical protein